MCSSLDRVADGQLMEDDHTSPADETDTYLYFSLKISPELQVVRLLSSFREQQQAAELQKFPLVEIVADRCVCLFVCDLLPGELQEKVEGGCRCVVAGRLL